MTPAVAMESIQVGLTKTFLRKSAHDVLEGRRTRLLTQAAVRIQCVGRGHPCRRRYLALLCKVVVLQKLVRGFVDRRKTQRLRRCRAALALQCFWRKWSNRNRYVRFRWACVRIQAHCAGARARRTVFAMRRTRDTIRLQSIVRCALARQRFVRLRRAAIVAQCCVRRKRAKAVLKALRVAAKDVGKLQTSNEALKKEIEELRERAAEEAKRARSEAEARASVAATEELARLREDLEASRAALETERAANKALKAELHAAAAEASRLRAEELTPAFERSSVLEAQVLDLTAQLEQLHTAPASSGSPKALVHPDAAQSLSQSLSLASKSASPSTSPRTGDTLAATEGLPPPAPTTAPASPKRNPADATTPLSPAVVATFEKNLATLRTKLRHGIKLVLWEEGPHAKIHNFECVLQLDKTYEVLSFTGTATKSAFALFGAQKAVEVQTVRLAHIVDVHPGAAAVHENTFVAMFGGGAAHSSTADMMTLVASCERPAPAAKTAIGTTSSATTAAGAGAAHRDATDGAEKELPTRTISLRLQGGREERNHLMTALRTMISDLHVKTSDRMKKGTAAAAAADVNRRRNSVQGMPTSADADAAPYESPKDMKLQLSLERSNYERLMIQLFALTNDLNEREESVTVLKKRVASLEQTLSANEKMHEQDAVIRLQLGKRLEQVLMDKEEALEELDMVQNKLESIRSAMALVDFSKAAQLAETMNAAKSPTRSQR